MEPGEQSGEVRARMAIIFTPPCSRPITHIQGHHRHGQKQRELPGKDGEWLVIYWPSPSLSSHQTAAKTALRSLGRYRDLQFRNGPGEPCRMAVPAQGNTSPSPCSTKMSFPFGGGRQGLDIPGPEPHGQSHTVVHTG